MGGTITGLSSHRMNQETSAHMCTTGTYLFTKPITILLFLKQCYVPIPSFSLVFYSRKLSPIFLSESLSACRAENSSVILRRTWNFREDWMITRTRLSRRRRILAPPPPHAPTFSPVRKLDRRLTGGLRKRDNLHTERGRGRSQILRQRESLVLYKSFNTVVSG